MRLLLAFLLALSSTLSTPALARFIAPSACEGAGESRARAYAEPLNGGLQYAQQRWLDPTTGRFLSLDPFAGMLSEPLSTQGFIYGRANPSAFVDPTGMVDEAILGRCLSRNELTGFDPDSSLDVRRVKTYRDCEHQAQNFQNLSYWIEGAEDKISRFTAWVRGTKPVANALETARGVGGEALASTTGGLNNRYRTGLADVDGMARAGDEVAQETEERSRRMGEQLGEYAATSAVTATAGVVARPLLGSARASVAVRSSPGLASGGNALPHIKGRWLRGTHGNAGVIPRQVADKLRGRSFESFDQLREEFWRVVSNDPDLSGQFSEANRKLMAAGQAPIASKSQQLGGQKRYHLHHVNPIAQGGGVYDLDNLIVVTPRFHAEVLDPVRHYGR